MEEANSCKTFVTFLLNILGCNSLQTVNK
jgi:hypothetical protein